MRSVARSPRRTSSVLSGTLVGMFAAAVLGGCATPISIKQLDPRDAHRQLTQSVLSNDQPSEMTRTTLRSRGLLAAFEDDPEAALRELHQIAKSGPERGRDVFALAEASFLHGRRTGKREHYLGAAIYALAFLFPGDADEPPGRFDPGTRLATDIYNAALVEAFRSKDGAHVDLAPGVYPLPFGELELQFAPEELVWAGRQLTDLMPVAELEVHGIRNRYRHSGIGAPLAALSVPAAGAKDSLVGPRVRVSLTVVLVVEGVRRALDAQRIRGRLEIYAANDTEQVTLENEQLPLQYEDTATLAATLAQPAVWERELAGFFGRAEAKDELPLLRAMTPHRAGKIPVVFVHGTASSPGRWADMVNDLWSSRSVRERFEPWFFMYDTGNPIAYSGAGLRKLLGRAVEQLDPESSDACLRQMVVIGHSQGGLLTKLTAVDTGDRLWNAVAHKPLDELSISPKTRDLLRAALFVEPLPFVRRVVFIATPHRGSYQALRSISGWVTRFVRVPRRLLSAAGELATLQTDGVMVASNVRGMPTSVDNMREGNPFLMSLASIPVAPGVARHSIIPVLGDGPIEDGKDGVVAYRSAHIDDADSELVVHSGHSTQAEPATIEEVRRILAVHADAENQAGLHCGPAADDAAGH